MLSGDRNALTHIKEDLDALRGPMNDATNRPDDHDDVWANQKARRGEHLEVDDSALSATDDEDGDYSDDGLPDTSSSLLGQSELSIATNDSVELQRLQRERRVRRSTSCPVLSQCVVAE